MNVTLADWKPTKKQLNNVSKVMKSGRLTYGPFTRELEEKFAQKHDFKHAIFTNSGTSALQVSWHYLKDKHGWKDGSEVLVSAVTFVATINTILQNNLKPVLVDVDWGTYNIDPELIESKITKKTVAICPVNLLGRPVDILAIKKIAKRYNLKIVEDSCETMFVDYPGTVSPVGSRADIACYSSYLAHIISTGVGGFICTNSDSAERYMRSMIWHGRDDSYLHIDANKTVPLKDLIHLRFKFAKPGYSYRLTELEAAIGVDEVDRSDEIIYKRNVNADYLNRQLLPLIEKIQLPKMDEDNAWMFFPIVCNGGVDRDKLCLFLEEKGIQTRMIMPLINQSVYKGLWNPNDYPIAQWLDKKGFLVGIHHYLKRADLDYIAKCISEYFE